VDRREDRPEHVDCDDPAHAILDLLEERAEGDDTGVVDEAVDPAERIDATVDDRVGAVPVAGARTSSGRDAR
jgi:hypothetical protein